MPPGCCDRRACSRQRECANATSASGCAGRRGDSPSCQSRHAPPGLQTAAAVSMGVCTHAAASGASPAHSLSILSAASFNCLRPSFGFHCVAAKRPTDARAMEPAPAHQVARALKRATDELKARDWERQTSARVLQDQDATVTCAPGPRHRWRLLPSRRVTPGRSHGPGGVVQGERHRRQTATVGVA